MILCIIMPIMAYSFDLVNKNARGTNSFYIIKQVAILALATCFLCLANLFSHAI